MAIHGLVRAAALLLGLLVCVIIGASCGTNKESAPSPVASKTPMMATPSGTPSPTPSPIPTETPTGVQASFGTYLLTAKTGAVTQITHDLFVFDADWHPTDDVVAFARSNSLNQTDTRSLATLDVATGVIRDIYQTNSGIGPPAWSPDGGRIAFGLQSRSRGTIHLVNADGTGLVQVADVQGSHLEWVANDRLVIEGLDGTYALTIGEAPVYLADDGYFASSPDGSWIVHQDPRGDSLVMIGVTDENFGVQTPVPTIGWGPLWSPDSTSFAFVCISDICLFEVATGQVSKLTSEGRHDFLRAWDVDGRTLYFSREPDAVDYWSKRIATLDSTTSDVSITGLVAVSLLELSPNGNYYWYLRYRDNGHTADVFIAGRDESDHLRVLQDVQFVDCAWSASSEYLFCPNFAGGD